MRVWERGSGRVDTDRGSMKSISLSVVCLLLQILPAACGHETRARDPAETYLRAQSGVTFAYLSWAHTHTWIEKMREREGEWESGQRRLQLRQSLDCALPSLPLSLSLSLEASQACHGLCFFFVSSFSLSPCWGLLYIAAHGNISLNWQQQRQQLAGRMLHVVVPCHAMPCHILL